MRVGFVGCALILSGVAMGCDSKQRAATESRPTLVTTTSRNASADTRSSAIATNTSDRSPTATPEANALEDQELDRLPVIPTPNCQYGSNGKWKTQSRALWAPIAHSVVHQWNPGDGYAPDSCVYLVRTLCGVDLVASRAKR